MNLISIFNPSDDFTRNLINNTLYYIVEDPSKNNIVNVISNLFSEAELPKSEQYEFTINFLKAEKIAKDGVGEFPITLHEVRKYISLWRSIPKLDKNIFMTFIFNYHFSQKENIYKAQKELKLNTFLFNPVINYDGDKKYLTFKSSKKGKSNQLKIDNFQLETANFFTTSSSTLISRIWLLLINLIDKYQEVIKYLKKSCCFLEEDAIEISEYLYNNLDVDHLIDLIKNMKEISFFCESISESILWK